MSKRPRHIQSVELLKDAKELQSYQVDDVPDLPVSYRLLASIPEYSNTLVLEGSLANFYSIRDYAVDQHHAVCHYDPIDGVLGIHKQVPESRQEMIMFYRMSARTIEVHAYWRRMRGSGSVSQNLMDSLIRSALESEDTPGLGARDPAGGCVFRRFQGICPYAAFHPPESVRRQHSVRIHPVGP